MNGDHPSAKESAQHSAAWRLVATLAVSGAIAGFLIVFAFEWAQPRILAHQATVLEAAIGEVLGEPDSTKTLFLYNGALTPNVPSSVDTTKLERVFAGYSDHLIGYAIVAAEPGFADVITLIFGYDARGRRILGMKVLDNKETPGLGDRIVKDTTFAAGFRGVVTPLKGVKRGAGKGEPDEVDMITGATISSRSVIGIINHKLEKIAPLLPAEVKP